MLIKKLNSQSAQPRNQLSALNILPTQPKISQGIERGSWLEYRSAQLKEEYKMNREMEERAALDPISYGGPGFGRGFVRDPAIQASTATVCPECAVVYGGAQLYSGVRRQNYVEAGSGVLNMLGGGISIYGRFSPTPAGQQLADLEVSTGGHFLSRHGAQTSLSSQYNRAISGMTPEGILLKEVDASRFLSDKIQLEAVNMAKAEFAISGRSNFVLDMKKIVGEGYLKGGGRGSYRTATQVQASFKDGQLQTIYPVLKR